jgi:hypothetical protein
MDAKKKSPIGKTNLNNYTVDDMCKIIQTCGEYGVKSFDLGDLSIKFDFVDNKMENIPCVPTILDPVKQQEEEKDEQTYDLVDAITLSEEVMEQLKLTDPYEWERLTIEDEANNG